MSLTCFVLLSPLGAHNYVRLQFKCKSQNPDFIEDLDTHYAVDHAAVCGKSNCVH